MLLGSWQNTCAFWEFYELKWKSLLYQVLPLHSQGLFLNWQPSSTFHICLFMKVQVFEKLLGVYVSL